MRVIDVKVTYENGVAVTPISVSDLLMFKANEDFLWGMLLSRYRDEYDKVAIETQMIRMGTMLNFVTAEDTDEPNG